MIVVCDTNVWVSAIVFEGVPYKAVRHALKEEQLVVSSYIESEIIRILAKRFHRELYRVQVRLDGLLKNATRIETTGEIRGVCRDPKDDAILETEWKARADYLVSGDKDLLELGEFRGTKIVSPAAYLALL